MLLRSLLVSTISVFYFVILVSSVRIPSIAQKPPRIGGPQSRSRESRIFIDRLLGNGSYGRVVEAVVSPSVLGPGANLGKPFTAVETCEGPFLGSPEEWHPAAAKCAAGEHFQALDYLAVEDYVNSKVTKQYRAHHPLARFFLRYYGQATTEAGHEPRRRWLLWERATGIVVPSELEEIEVYQSVGDLISAPEGAVPCMIKLGFGDNRQEALKDFVAQLFTALGALQAISVVHRDIKPENILLVRSAHHPEKVQIKIIDFGSATDLSFLRKVGYDYRFSPVTPKYCPPEQFLDESKPFSFDSFCAGLTLMRLIFPALASEDAYESFVEEFKGADWDLDKWLSQRFSSKGTSDDEEQAGNLLEEGLAAFRSDELGPSGWRFLKWILTKDPRRRPTPSEALASPFIGYRSDEDTDITGNGLDLFRIFRM